MAFLVHHGIPGQKWGIRRGPPYPIDDKVLKKGTKVRPFSILWDLIRGRDVSRVLGRIRWERHLRRKQKKESK